MIPPGAFLDEPHQDDELCLLSPASHHFISSSFGNQEHLRQNEGPASIDIHPDDAAARNRRWPTRTYRKCARLVRGRLLDYGRRAARRRGDAQGLWHQNNLGHSVNSTTSDALADFAGQSTFHSNYVRAAGGNFWFFAANRKVPNLSLIPSAI